MSVQSPVAPPFASPRSPSRQHAEDACLEANPSFHETALLDVLRENEYGRLDESGHVYLDYTGGSLCAESQLEEHMRLFRGAVVSRKSTARVSPPATAAPSTLLIGHPRLVVCLDRRRERASASCPVQGLKQTSPSRRW